MKQTTDLGGGEAPPPKRDRVAELVRAETKDPAFWDGIRDIAHRAIDAKAILEKQAQRDLILLGIDLNPESIDAYWNKFILQESLLTRDVEAVIASCNESLKDLSPKAGAFLPIRASKQSAGKRLVALSDEQYEDWLRAVMATIELRIFHERAIRARSEYLDLVAEPTLPSRRIFLQEQDRRLRSWRTANEDSRDVPLDRIAGLSAAAASECQLLSLRHQLREADECLLPVGSYLSKKSPPRKIHLRSHASIGLRKAMGTQASKLMVSKAIAATYATFTPQLIFVSEPGGIKRAAVDTIERERQRIAPEAMKLAEASIERARKLREFLE